MIRVLQVVPDMRSGGLESLIMNLYRNIDRTEVQFDFLTHYSHHSFYDEEIEKLGGRIYRLSVREDNDFRKYRKDLRLFFREHREYKIVHGHMASTAIFYLYYAKKAGVPVRIVHSHNTDTEKSIKGFIKRILLKCATLFANEYFACSVEAGKFLYGNKDFRLIKNAIKLDQFKFNERVRNEYRQSLKLEDKFVVGHVGRFNVQKNHFFILQVFHALSKRKKNVKLLLVGKGELEDKIKKRAEELDIAEQVLFLGARYDVNNLYQAMDAFIMPSLFEGLPVAGIEAQAAGLPLIVSDKVTTELQVTPLVVYKSLNDSCEKWAEELLKFENMKRKDFMKEMVDKGYCIQEEVGKLMEYYLAASDLKSI